MDSPVLPQQKTFSFKVESPHLAITVCRGTTVSAAVSTHVVLMRMDTLSEVLFLRSGYVTTVVRQPAALACIFFKERGLDSPQHAPHRCL